jgi:hypothetical protein
MKPPKEIPKLLNPEIWKEITPVWFNWLRWFLTLGAVGYTAQKTQNVGLQIIYGISYVAFFMFITTSIADLMKLKALKNHRANSVVTFLLAVGVLFFSHIVLDQSIKALLKG